MISHSARETQKIAEDLAKKILKKRKKTFVLALKGDLGGGKTTFLQGLAKGLGIKEEILSPTFNIFKKFKAKDRTFYHFDCWRIEKPEEIIKLGFGEIIRDPNNIVAIEWAEKIKEIVPKDALWIDFNFVNETTRTIDFDQKREV